MPYSVSWYIKDEIVYTRYSGVVTPDEMRKCMIEATELIESSPRNLVHAISDVGDVMEAVSLKDSITIVREVGMHPRAGWSFVIREKSPLIKMGAAMGASIFRMRYKALDTMEQVREHLKFFDQDIHWENADESVIGITKA